MLKISKMSASSLVSLHAIVPLTWMFLGHWHACAIDLCLLSQPLHALDMVNLFQKVHLQFSSLA